MSDSAQSVPQLPAPQLVVDSRMLYTSWIPADPQACARLLPPKLRPADNHAVYMNQYVVERPEQTTGFGAYSLTYLGLDVGGLFAPDGVTPARFFTHYLNSSPVVRAYVEPRGVPARPGRTTVEVQGNEVTATTYADERPVIRSRARIAPSGPGGGRSTQTVGGHLRYITRVGDRLVAGNYPFIGDLVSPFEVLSIEFLAEDHPLWALRPKQPLEVVAASSFFAPRDSFVYPGGEEDIGPAE